MREFFTEVRSCRMCLCEWGTEHDPLVICLHGIRDQGAVWEPVAAPLASARFRVVAPDLRGHGRSSHASRGALTNLIDLLADLDRLTESLTEQPFVLVGHSMGSMLAAIFAAVRPEKVVHAVLVEPVLPSQGQGDDIVALLRAQLDYLAAPADHPSIPDIETAALVLRSATPSLSDAFSLALAARGTQRGNGALRWRWDPLLRNILGVAFNGTKEQYLALLQRITIPLSLVVGASSRYLCAEDQDLVRAAIPSARSLTLPGGHNVHIESAAALSRCIAEAGGAVVEDTALIRSA